LRLHQNGLHQILAKLATSLLLLQHNQLFGRGLGNGEPSTIRIFPPSVLSGQCFHHADGCQEVVGNCPGAGKRICLEKSLKLPPKKFRVVARSEEDPYRIRLCGDITASGPPQVYFYAFHWKIGEEIAMSLPSHKPIRSDSRARTPRMTCTVSYLPSPHGPR
jgi:hypothetical protein